MPKVQLSLTKKPIKSVFEATLAESKRNTAGFCETEVLYRAECGGVVNVDIDDHLIETSLLGMKNSLHHAIRVQAQPSVIRFGKVCFEQNRGPIVMVGALEFAVVIVCQRVGPTTVCQAVCASVNDGKTFPVLGIGKPCLLRQYLFFGIMAIHEIGNI